MGRQFENKRMGGRFEDKRGCEGGLKISRWEGSLKISDRWAV